MNIDYGFFQLFRALKCLHDHKNESALGEEQPALEQKLPSSNYSLLRNLSVHPHCYQERRVRRERFDFGTATTCQCSD
jgi:hypothetical protein